jgi:hypothetical protein
MTDLTLAEMVLGFKASVIGVFTWASIDYNRFIKFWMLGPAPYTQRVSIAFLVARAP